MSVLKPLIGVINLSKKLSNDDAKTMVIACQEQLNNDVAPHWHMQSWYIIFYSDPKTISPRAFPIVILDSPDEPDALGYHAEQNGKPYGRVFIDPIIQNGGAIFHNPLKPQNPTISSVLSHEVVELFIDKDTNLWAEGPAVKAGNLYAYEACDPVQGNSYTKVINGKTVALSNFVLPAWFNPQNPAATSVDYMKTAPGAFQLALGGYMVVKSISGTEQEVFGEIKPPDWMLEVKKHSSGRTARRLSAHKSIKKSWWKYLL